LNNIKINSQFRHFIRLILRFFAYWLAFFFLFSSFWLTSNFGKPSIEQILYHLQFGLQGLVDTDMRLVDAFIQQSLLVPLCFAVALLLLEVALAYHLLSHLKSGVPHHKKHYFFLHKVGRLFYWFIHHRAPLYTLLACFMFFAINFSLVTYISQKFGKDYFAENYLNPDHVEIQLNKPKNLILIYVESLESAYRDPTLFNRNLLQRLDDLDGTSFEYFQQAPGTNWTIAGITASQCGIPLKSLTLYDGNGVGENIRSFLPNATCLGDILHQHGYYNVYMGGDALSFSGKGNFFADHHYGERYGRNELKGNLTEKEMNYWGLYDDDLFSQVKPKLKALHHKKQPFNLTITTIDTHGPDGHYSNLCKKQGVKDFAGIVECTSHQVTDFVRFVQKQGYLKDTNIVIIGDHLAMYNPVHETLDAMPKRYIYNKLITEQKITKTRDHILHFDLFPTILELSGFKINGGKLGLGFTAITPNLIQPTENNLEQMNDDLLNESETYIELWKPESEAPTDAGQPETDTKSL
jgi:phosphoglycerol transferase